MRAAAARPSALAWNSAPARRIGRKTSGDTSSTASAVPSVSVPPRSRRPSSMATSPTPSPASISMASADRKATRKVPIVVWRSPSLAAATSRRPWSWRPKARSVGSPWISSRYRADSDASRRHWRPVRRADSLPKYTIDTGTSAASPSRTSSEGQSSNPTHTRSRQGVSTASTTWGR